MVFLVVLMTEVSPSMRLVICASKKSTADSGTNSEEEGAEVEGAVDTALAPVAAAGAETMAFIGGEPSGLPITWFMRRTAAMRAVVAVGCCLIAHRT